MKWDDFKSMDRHMPTFFASNREPTDIECPRCGKTLYRRTDIVLTSYPPQSQYECNCGFVGYA